MWADRFYKPKTKTLVDVLIEMHSHGDTVLLGFGGREHQGWITAFGEDFVYFQVIKGPRGVSTLGGKSSDLLGRVKHVPFKAITSVAHIQEA